MSQKVRKAVIPAAGFGTRFLPQTKAMPKEMLPIVDKPVIQIVVEELVEAGITEVIIVTGYHKRSIEDHFDHNFELESELERAGKTSYLEELLRINNLANFYYIRQKGPKGNATPILNAREIIGDEPFVVFWGDDFIKAEPSRAKQLIAAYEKYGTTILGGIKAEKDEDYARYGFAAGEKMSDGAIRVTDLIEKPGKEKAPSDLAIVSGQVYNPDIFDAIEEANRRRKDGEELVYIDAINVLRERGQQVHALPVEGGVYYDCGNVLEYLKTVVSMGLQEPKVGDNLKKWLKQLDL
jgi:UTP--glucose-1-phosphate uridylyltransferase